MPYPDSTAAQYRTLERRRGWTREQALAEKRDIEDAVLLRRDSGDSVADIARDMGVTRGRVYQNYNQAWRRNYRTPKPNFSHERHTIND